VAIEGVRSHMDERSTRTRGSKAGSARAWKPQSSQRRQVTAVDGKEARGVKTMTAHASSWSPFSTTPPEP